MELVGPVLLDLASWARHHRDVARNALARRRANEEAEKRPHVLNGRDDLLHAHDRDVGLGHRGRHSAVALIGHQDERSRLGNKEIRARDSHVGLNELFA